MKKIALISTFCNTEEKQNLLYENILKIKELGIDVIALGPNFIQLPSYITEACDYFFYTKDNPLLTWPTRAYTHWYQHIHSDDKILRMNRGLADYGWAALYQTKKLSQIALTFDYDMFYHLIYDVELDNHLINELLGTETNIIHRRINPKNTDEIWDANLHFMVFDRPTMEKIEKDITLEEDLGTNWVAEGEVIKWRDKYNLTTSDHLVVDKIFYWDDYDFFNYSPFPEFKMFLSKNEPMDIWVGDNPVREDLTSNLRMVFFHFGDIGPIKVEVNGKIHILTPKEFEFVEFPIDSKDVNSLFIEYNGKLVDFSKDYSDIMMNQIYYNRK